MAGAPPVSQSSSSWPRARQCSSVERIRGGQGVDEEPCPAVRAALLAGLLTSASRRAEGSVEAG